MKSKWLKNILIIIFVLFILNILSNLFWISICGKPDTVKTAFSMSFKSFKESLIYNLATEADFKCKSEQTPSPPEPPPEPPHEPDIIIQRFEP
ncbi:MAG: hypothetical protein AABY32_02740, partial [Nanoarchaeota archaeon]